MGNLLKISIPKPCHEDWEKMSPDATGRFCGSCAKSVVDFTGMKAAEIRDYFILHQNEKVCGKFYPQQIDSLVIEIPNAILYSQTQFHKMFLLALLIAMGTTLFSCSDKDGNKQKIDQVVVTDTISKDTISNKRHVLGMSLPQKDSVNPQKTERVKFNKSQSKITMIPVALTGDVAVEPIPPKVKVYKDSITMENGQ